MNKARERLLLGRVLRPRGLAGEVYLYLYADPEDIPEDLTVFVALSPHLERPLTLTDLRPHAGRVYRARFREVLDRTAASALTGLDLWVEEDALKTEEGALYAHELVGMEVVDEAGAVLGVVEEVYLYPAQEVLEIRQGSRVFLLPLVKAFVLEIRRGVRQVVVRLPEGLMEE